MDKQQTNNEKHAWITQQYKDQLTDIQRTENGQTTIGQQKHQRITNKEISYLNIFIGNGLNKVYSCQFTLQKTSRILQYIPHMI